MNVISRIVLISTVLVLAACNGGKNLAKDDSVDYKSAKQLPEIQVPEMKTPVRVEPSDPERKK